MFIYGSMLFFIFSIFSPITNAEEPNGIASKKAAIALETLARNARITYLFDNIGEPSYVEEVEVPRDVFEDHIKRYFKAISALTVDSEMQNRVKQFVAQNKLTHSMVGYYNLKAAEDALVSILVILKFQKKITERADLHYFGKKTIDNLNEAIRNLVRSQFQTTEEFLNRVGFNREYAKSMLENFIKVGISYERVLSPSERWVNELLGLGRDHTPTITPKEVLNEVLQDNIRLVNQKLRMRRSSICQDLF